MRRLSAFLAILLLLSTVAPLMACVTGSAMSSEESACCRSMHGDCGDMAKMGCCHKQIKTDSATQAVAFAQLPQIQWIAVAFPARLSECVSLTSRAAFDAPQEHSPPGLQIARTTVLRI